MLTRTRVKVCGVTKPHDARVAVDLGADAIGVNFHPGSRRLVTTEQAKAIVKAVAPFVEVVGVFVEQTPEQIRAIIDAAGLSAIQLHGDYPPSALVQLGGVRATVAFPWEQGATEARVAAYLSECASQGAMPVGVLIDTKRGAGFGGTGLTWDWAEARDFICELPIVLAGGLSPENVERAIELLDPYGVDVAGGVEAEPGIKDPEKIGRFLNAVASADKKKRIPQPELE